MNLPIFSCCSRLSFLSGAIAFLLAWAPAVQAIEVAESALPGDTELEIQTGSVAYSVVVRGNEETGPTRTTYDYIVYVTGTDVYGNAIYIEDKRGVVAVTGRIANPGDPVIPATTARISGTWVVPNDGTLHNVTSGYRLVVAVYNRPPGRPTDIVNLDTGRAIFEQSGRLAINVVPDLAINSPGVVYTAGSYRGKDIIRFTGSWRNDASGADSRQSRPLRSNTEDRYSYNLRLTTDPEFRVDNNQTNDDFSLLSVTLSGDLPLLPDGSTQYRKITVTGTPGAVPAYGLDGVNGTARIYTPQPDDGFLDIGERVELTTEQLIPGNYVGRYFVAARVRMSGGDDLDASPSNNIFVSNAANKIEILETASPTVEPASSISTQNGVYLQGGRGASDYSSVSEGGGRIVFESAANNLRIPPNLAQQIIEQFGPDVDMAGPEVESSAFREQVLPFLTQGRQIFMRDRSTREIRLISRTPSGVQATADCLNPMVSANGRYVAYNSTADNLVSGDTGGRSMIYVFDTDTLNTVVVSKNSAGQFANGDSFNPTLSESGRFVVFESRATNLDLPQFRATVSGGAVTGFSRLRGGAGFSRLNPPLVTITDPTGQGQGATARATVNSIGVVTSLTVINPGQGYAVPPVVTIQPPEQFSPPEAGQGQVYLHDRDANGNGIFDEAGPGRTATYLVSLTDTGAISNNLAYAPVINLQDSVNDLAQRGGMYVAFASYGQNMPLPNGAAAMIYRVLVDVTDDDIFARGPLIDMIEPVSVNEDGTPPVGNTALGIVPYSVQPAINGDGSQVAFTSAGINLVWNAEDGAFNGDTNEVQDVFVRDFRKPLFTPGNGAVSRISVSQNRVATGVVYFQPTSVLGNVPDSRPVPDVGESVTIGDGVTTRTFVFTTLGGGDNVPVGNSVQETRDNLIARINSSGLSIMAEPTTPPNVNPPGTAFLAGIYLKNLAPGKQGNVPIVFNSPALAGEGMAGGGRQAEDAPEAVQGVPFGSSHPSISRSGRYVAFRTIAANLDVHEANESNTYPTSPITGELIRPLIFPTSNVYLHDRLADGDLGRPFDLLDNYRTERVSVNKFGYPTFISSGQIPGLNASTSANSAAPAISADGRFITFSSDSEGMGGLVFGPNNLTPLDNQKFRDIFVHDRRIVGPNPPQPTTKPTVAIQSPADGLVVTPGTSIAVNATARASAGKAISSVELFVNGVSQGVDTLEPFTWLYEVPTTGDYNFRVEATDDRGLTSDASVLVRAEPPVEGAPFVQMTQPLGGVNFVTGSQFFLNARTTAVAPATIDPSSVGITVNGSAPPGELKRLGDTYGVLYTPTTPFTVDTYRAQATDSANRFALSGPLFSTLNLTLKQLPAVEMVPFSMAERVEVGGFVSLQARAFFPEDANEQARVEFYVDNVFVGVGQAGAADATGRVTYTLLWEVPELEPGDPVPKIYDVRARAVALNFFTEVEQNNRIEFFGSVVSAPQALQVFGVPRDLDPSTDAGFVAEIYRKLLYTEPNYTQWSNFTTALSQGLISRAAVIAGLMGYEESTQTFVRTTPYARTSGLAYSFYGRLPLLTPAEMDIINFIELMETDLTPLPITSYAGVAGAPYGSTYGMARAVQSVILDSWQFGFYYPQGSGDVVNVKFVEWMQATMFPGRETGGNSQSTLVGMMNNISPQSNRRGAAVAFNAAFVTTLLAEYNRDPGGVEKIFQRRIATAALRFQLGLGDWQSSLSFGNANPFSAAVVQSLLTSAPLPEITNGSAQAFASLLANGVSAVTVVNGGTGYTVAPTVTIGAPLSGLRASATAVIAGGQVTGIQVTNPGSGYFSVPSVSVSPPSGVIVETAKVGDVFSLRLTANNEGDYFYAEGLPPGLQINATTGIISGLPTADATPGFAATTYNVSVSSSSWAGRGPSRNLQLTVNPPTPVITSLTSVTGRVGQPFNYQITATFQPTSFGAVGLPQGLSINATTGLITGTPALEDISTSTITATNAGGVGSAFLTIQVLPATAPPAAAPTPFTAWVNTFNLTGDDALPHADPDGDGVSNIMEFALGTRPDRPDTSPLVVESVPGSSTQVRVSWTQRKGAADGSYRLQQSPGLCDVECNWTDVITAAEPTVRGATEPEYERVELTLPRGSQKGFYRLLVNFDHGLMDTVD